MDATIRLGHDALLLVRSVPGYLLLQGIEDEKLPSEQAQMYDDASS